MYDRVCLSNHNWYGSLYIKCPNVLNWIVLGFCVTVAYYIHDIVVGLNWLSTTAQCFIYFHPAEPMFQKTDDWTKSKIPMNGRADSMDHDFLSPVLVLIHLENQSLIFLENLSIPFDYYYSSISYLCPIRLRKSPFSAQFLWLLLICSSLKVAIFSQNVLSFFYHWRNNNKFCNGQSDHSIAMLIQPIKMHRGKIVSFDWILFSFYYGRIDGRIDGRD